MALVRLTQLWTSKPPEKLEDIASFISREGLPIWRQERELVNGIVNIINNGGMVNNVANFTELTVFDETGFPDGAIVWVQSVHRGYVLETSSAAPDFTNDIIASTTPGRSWFGVLTDTRYWMLQLNWFIDDAGNREGTGSSSADPIPEYERQLRMGLDPQWRAGEYHLRYPTDLDSVWLRGSIADGSAIFLHGSLVDGQGQAVLMSGTMDALVVRDYPTNVPWQATVNAIPASWTASGFISASSSTRLRMTSGASVGAKFWPTADLGAKTARLCNGMQAVTYTLASIQTPAITYATTATIAANDTFVAERLTQVKNIRVDVKCPSRNLGQGTGLAISDITARPSIIIESMALGVRAGVYGSVEVQGARASVFFDGCLLAGYSSGSEDAEMQFVFGCATANLSSSHRMPPRAMYHAGFSLGEMFMPDVVDNNAVAFFKDWIIQGNGVGNGGIRCFNKARLEAFRMGAFDCLRAVALRWGSQMTFHVEAAGNIAFWGTGNTTGFELQPKCLVTYPTGQGTGLTMACTNQIMFQSGAKTQARAFDDAVGAYTAPITMTFANLLASIATGGFGEQIHDPTNGCYVGLTGSVQQ